MACNNEQQGNRKYNVERMFEFLKFWWEMHPEDFNKANINLLLHAMKDRRPDALNHFKLLFLKAPSPSSAPSSSGEPNSTSKTEPQEEIEDKTETCKARLKKCTFREQLGAATNTITAKDFLDVATGQLAKEMTMLDFELFSRVKCGEFLHHVWHASQRQTLAPNITAYIARFNEVSYWVVTEILMTRRKEQMIVLRKFIRLANSFLQLNNFNSLITIMSALNNSTITRLKDAWAALPEKDVATFRSMEELLSNQQNFSNYFQEFKKRPFPKLPYFALFLRDCTFIHDGNKPYNRHGMINFEYMTMLYQCLQAVRECQSHPYDLPHHKDTQAFLWNLNYIDDEDALYMLSLKAQPSLWTNEAVEEVVKEDEDSSDSYSWSDSPSATSTPLDNSTIEAEEGTQDDLTSFDGYSEDEGFSLEKTRKPRQQKQQPSDSKRVSTSTKRSSKHKKGKRHRKKLALDGEALDKEKMVIRSLKGVPPRLVPFFFHAEQVVDQYFSNCIHSVTTGTISIDLKNWKHKNLSESGYGEEERLILVRATAMSVDFFTSLRDNFGFFGVPKKSLQTAAQRQHTQAMLTGFGFTPVSAESTGTGESVIAEKKEESLFEDYTEEVTAKLLYDFGYVSGMGDCQAFSKFTGATGPDVWAMGPICFVLVLLFLFSIFSHLIAPTCSLILAFSYSGRCNKEIVDNDRELDPDDFYSEGIMQFSFEADSWVKSGKFPPKLNPIFLPKRETPSTMDPKNCTSVCHYWCGFAAGWTSAALGKQFVCCEARCMGRGDPVCVGILTYPHKLNKHIKEYYKRHHLPDKSAQVLQYNFMDTKDAFASSTKAILSADQHASSSSSSVNSSLANEKKKNKDSSSHPQGSIKFPVVGRKKLPGQLESRLDNAELISTTTKEDLAHQEQIKAKQTAIFSQLFSQLVCNPSKGKVALETSGARGEKAEERYVFLRAETLSTMFYEVVSSLMAQREESEKSDDQPRGEGGTGRKGGHYQQDKEVIARSFATNFLYDFGRCFAKSDFTFFTRTAANAVPAALKSKEEQFLQRMFSLPEILRHVGWGKLSILSSLSLLNYDPKNRFKHFFLRYTVKNSFEASVYVKDQWTKAKQQLSQQSEKNKSSKTLKQLRQQYVQPSPVCILNCGYVNSFLEECIHSCASPVAASSASSVSAATSEHHPHDEREVQLGTVEVSCVACGHETCEFLVAPAELMFAHVMRYLKEKGREEEVGRLRGLEIVMRRFKHGRGYFSRLFRK
ncbi:hypothetical protein QOT17_003230 [Balamuthia mandrillaris]